MPQLVRSYKFSGMIAADDRLHAVHDDSGRIIAPHYVQVPGGKYVAQYAPTVRGKSIAYNPAGNCDGNFMSSKFQPNNNCYNYGCNIATNSFAQPGRAHGFFLNSPPTGKQVSDFAQKDGLIWVGGADADLDSFAASAEGGHYVALFISPGDSSVNWPGDYHWARCDVGSPYDSWSQKDGGDQVTNFDFAGQPIILPPKSNWVVNQGPMIQGNPGDVVISYDFYGYLWVPDTGVDII